MSNCTKLKFWLIRNGVSQKRISDETGLHQNTLTKVVRTGEGSKSVKVLLELYLRVKHKVKEAEFETLLEVDKDEEERG